MPVPADSAAPPLAVLVLAWGEAAPAVRALVKATQASAPVVDSILVLVPQANDPDHPSAEEYLPVPPLATALQPVATPTEPESLSLPVAGPTLPVATSVASEGTYPQVIDSEDVAERPTVVNSTPPTPLAWAAVRVLRLGSLSLPQLAQLAGQPLPAPTWLGPAATPAAPYLGASVLANQLALATAFTESGSYPRKPETPELLPEPLKLPAVAAKPLPITEAGFPTKEVPLYDPIAQAPDPEADLPAINAEELATAEIVASDQADTELLTTANPRSAVQAGWPEALAALRQPTRLPKPPVAEPGPATTHYSAPDLNFQIIQYARFAVPVALAGPPFAVVYAPAWPTWLAAQELRQRTGQPLVLHVSTLAATADESVDTATGWIAELQRQALRRADLILAETPALAQRLRHDLGLPTSAVQAVPAADTDAVAQALYEVRLRPLANLT